MQIFYKIFYFYYELFAFLWIFLYFCTIKLGGKSTPLRKLAGSPRAPRARLRKKQNEYEHSRNYKDNMFPVPPLFKIIQEQSGTDWAEMYKVFNMGHRLEVYVAPEDAEKVISISKGFNIDAQVVGRIEEGKKSLLIKSDFGEFEY